MRKLFIIMVLAACGGTEFNTYQEELGTSGLCHCTCKTCIQVDPITKACKAFGSRSWVTPVCFTVPTQACSAICGTGSKVSPPSCTQATFEAVAGYCT